MSPVGAALFAPMILVSKSAALPPTGCPGIGIFDVNCNGQVNPGDTLAYSVDVINNGSDAMGVVFTDTLDANLTLVAGSVNASPIAVNDSYGSIGNVGINVNTMAGSVLANDLDPNANPIAVSGIVGCADLAAPFVCATANGSVTMQANGQFTYLSTAGFEGMDTFTYTASDGSKTDTGLVTINVNEVIWFIDNNASNGDGRLGTPFNSIPNFNAGAADEPGDIIFVYRLSASDYTGSSLTLLADQKLIGQGSTASLATSFTPNLVVPPFSPLPATSGTRPTLTNTNTNVTVSTGNTIRGVNINNTTAGSALLGTSFNNLTISETTVSSSNATAAVNLDQGSGTASINVSFISVTASSTTNGIVLADTTGSFTVNGDGSNTTVGGNGTGGTIQNTTGSDGTTAGIGIYLNNTTNVTLRQMQINDHPNFALRGLNVSNVMLEYTRINGVNGTNPSDNEGTMAFNELTGAALFKDSIIEGGIEDNVRVINTGGTLNRIVFNNVTIGQMDLGNANGDNAVLLQAQNNAVMNVTVQDSDFTHARGDIFQLDLAHTATSDLIFDNNTINNQHPNVVTGGGGITLSGGGSPTANTTLTYEFDNNTFQGARGSALLVILQTGAGSASGRIEGNTFGVSGTDKSGSREASDIEIRTVGRGAQTVLINNNQIRQYGNHGIVLQMGDQNVAGSTGTIGGLSATVTNNTIEQPNSNVFTNKNGVHVNLGTTSGDTYQACIDILNNTGHAAGSTDASLGSDYVLRQRQLTTMQLPGYGGAATDNAAVVAYIQGRNVGAETVFAFNQNVGSGAGGFIGGANCTQPPAFAPPVETESSPAASARGNDTAHLLEELTGGEPLWLRYFNAQISDRKIGVPLRAPGGRLAAQRTISQPARPVLAAFATAMSYVNPLTLFEGSAAAAERKPAEPAVTRAVPPRTMLVNSRGEYRIVPTAAIPATFSGDTITINGSGSGFTIPAGESTTVMFNAQVANPLPAGVCSIPNQATVMGSNFADVMSNTVMTTVETPPTITGVAALTRQQGSAASNSQIATVDDCNQAENTLVVTVSGGGTVNGVTVSNIQVAANGNVTADVVASCTATDATFTLTVTDSTSQTATTSLTVNVTANTPPTLGSYPNTGPINVGAGATVTPSAAPTDNGSVATLTASAPGFAGTFSGNTTTGVITITNASPGGTYTVTVTATDNCGATTTTTFQLVVNSPPTITGATISRQQGSAASSSQVATVNDADQAANTLVVTVNGGATATVNGVTVSNIAVAANGSVTADVVADCTAINATFTLTVTDNAGVTANATLTVNVTPNTPPTLSYSSPQTLTAGTSTTVSPATGPSDNGSVATIVVDSVSPGTGLTASVNNSTGVVTLNATVAGSYTVNIKATDNCGATTVASFTVNVTCPTITVNPATLPNGSVGSSYSQNITASPAGGNYTFAHTSGTLPPGLTLASNGTLSGTPTTNGSYTFEVTATGFGTCTGSRSYTITIGCPTITITTTSLPDTSRGALYNQTINVSPSGSYTFTISSGSLPPGLSLNSSTGVISGTPTTNGTYTFTVTVSAGGSCTASRSYTIRVNGQCPNVTQHDNLPNGTVGVAYFGSLSHVTPTNDYIITLQAGTLPPGLTIDNVQTALVGTPTTAGSYPFTLRATAPSGCYDDRIYTVVISNSFAVQSDFDGDRKADPAVFRGAQADWLLSLSGTNTLETPAWGAPGDQIAAGDYDGDRKVDLAVFCPTDGHWRIKRSSDGVTIDRAWGVATDTPVPGDYDGDGKTDLAVWRSGEGNWRIINSSDGAEQIVQWGLDSSGSGDVVPVPSDYDGDGKTDLAVFHKLSGTWSIRRSSDGAILTEQWGLSSDTPVPGDYDGDGKTDLAVWRVQQGRWLILRSSDKTPQIEVLGDGMRAFKDVPVPGDYDGDGKTDLAVWRPGLGLWYSRNSSDGATRTLQLGQKGDLPVTAVRGQ